MLTRAKFALQAIWPLGGQARVIVFPQVSLPADATEGSNNGLLFPGLLRFV